MLLKICWIREKINDYSQIDLLWFNFIESSKRKISEEKAKQIITPANVLRVGIFWSPHPNPLPIGEGIKEVTWKNLTKSDLADFILIAKDADINALQIHWKCDFSYLKMFWFFVISSISISDLENFEIDEDVDFYIIDWQNPWSWEEFSVEIFEKNIWQNSKVFEKNISTFWKIQKPFLIAGWINASNIKEKIKFFEQFENFSWFDIASWVETWDNIDEEKIKKILKIIN